VVDVWISWRNGTEDRGNPLPRLNLGFDEKKRASPFLGTSKETLSLLSFSFYQNILLTA
jgi:hypothetical protein